MTENHPITPPPELVRQWYESTRADKFWIKDHQESFASRAAQWGADQELEACCEWIADWYGRGCNEVIGNLRTARRPKPPSLKEQAMVELDGIAAVFRMSHGGDLVCDKIRRALEALPND
jgi:hypothetical protein